MPRIRYSAEVRAEAVRLVLESQVPVAHVAKQFGCSESIVHQWLNKFRSHSSPSHLNPSSPSASSARFLPVEVVDHQPPQKSLPTSPSAAVEKSSSVEIVTPGGFTLKFSDATPHFIAAVLEVLPTC